MTVTRMRLITSKPRPRPKVGDVKIVKGVRYVRVVRPALGAGGRVIGHQVSNGRTLFNWVRAPNE